MFALTASKSSRRKFNLREQLNRRLLKPAVFLYDALEYVTLTGSRLRTLRRKIICAKIKCILWRVRQSYSTQYWHSSVPSDEGYLRQDKAKSDALTLCMCKPLNIILAQHHSL